MTREGIIVTAYADEVEARPFSVFSQNNEERASNDKWRDRALAWGNQHFDKFGHRKACEHGNYDENFELCTDCGMTKSEILA